jgi:uncharacterized protein YqgC (DUF456 family)
MLEWLLKVARIVVGVGLILVGLAAFFTPLTPGSWLVVVGLEMLGWRFAYGRYLKAARRWIEAKWASRNRS